MLRPGIATWWKHAWLYGGKSKTKSRFVFRICQKPSLCLQSGLTKYTFSNNPGSGKCPFWKLIFQGPFFSTSKIRNSTARGHPRCFLQIWDFAVWPWSTAPTCCPSTYLAACLCFTVKDMCWDALTHDSSWDQSSQLFLSISINTTVPIWFSLGVWTRIYKAKIKCSPPTSGDERALDRTTFFFKSELPCWCHHCAAYRRIVSLAGNFFLRTTRALFRRFGVAVPLINPLPNKVTLYMSPGLQSGCWRSNMRMAFQYHWDSKLSEHACSQRQEVGSTCWDSCSCCRSGGDSAVTDWLTDLLADWPTTLTKQQGRAGPPGLCKAAGLKIWKSDFQSWVISAMVGDVLPVIACGCLFALAAVWLASLNWMNAGYFD